MTCKYIKPLKKVCNLKELKHDEFICAQTEDNKMYTV